MGRVIVLIASLGTLGLFGLADAQYNPSLGPHTVPPAAFVGPAGPASPVSQPVPMQVATVATTPSLPVGTRATPVPDPAKTQNRLAERLRGMRARERGRAPRSRQPRPRHNNLVKLGAAGFFLQDSSSDIRGDLTPENLQVDVEDRIVLAGSYTRLIGDRLGIEIPLGTPVKFGIRAAGPGEGLLSPLTESLSGQEIATVDALPITVIGNVYFTGRDATARPYLGLGINHTSFSDEKAGANLEAAILGDTDIDLESSTNIGAFAGINVRLSDNLHASLLAGYVNVDTTATITTDTVLPLSPDFGIPLGEFTREVDVQLNPIIGLVSLGISF